MILYIHGFISSPQSFKAQQTVEFWSRNFPDCPIVVPQLPARPLQAIALLQDIFDKNQSIIKGLIGSSLGGYYATYFVEKYSVKSVLVNPAVRPYELFANYLGPQTNPYTNEQFVIDSGFLEALERLDTAVLHNQDCYWLLQQEGDEVLDHRQAVSRYQSCKQTVEPLGDHSFVGFERYLPQIAEYFGLINSNHNSKKTL